MAEKKIVAHIMIPYIRATETFIYDRISHHSSYRPFVLTDEPAVNTEQFPFPDIRSLADRPLMERKLDALMKKTFFVSPYFIGALKKGKPRVAHAHYGPVGAGAAISCANARTPLMVSFYGIDASAFLDSGEYTDRYRELFRRAAAVSALSEDMKDRLVSAGCPAKKTHVHHLAVDTAALIPGPCRNDGGANIVSVGRLVPKKGMTLLTEAFSRIAKSARSARLHIYGDGPMEREIRELIAFKKLNNNILLHGARPRAEVLDAIRSADAFALFSTTGPDGDMEGTPTVLIEAGALGVPSVSTLHAGIPEVVLDGKTGLLCGEKDVEAFAGNLSRLIENPSVRSEMGTAARKHIEEHFDIRKVMGLIERCYDDISQ